MCYFYANKMAKEILIYGSIDECTSASFIEEINEALEEDANSEFVVRINSNGGSPEYTWGMIAKFNELKGAKSVKNDGKSFSMGLYFNCYVENASALDVSQFLLHRAAYPSWIENDPEYFSDAMRSNLENINKKLRAAFEAKVDVTKFENLKSVKDKGITLDKVFSMEGRLDVMLTAKEAKQIGLINEIINITPTIKAEIESKVNNYTVGVAAKYNEVIIEDKQIQKPKTKTMTIEQLKAEHPAVYAQALALGVAGEKDRVGSIMAFNEIDPDLCLATIKSGASFTETQKSELMIKGMSKLVLAKTKEESAAPVVTEEVKTGETEKEVNAKAFLADVKAGV